MWAMVDGVDLLAVSLDEPADAAGWAEVGDTARPDDTAQTTWEPTITVLDGSPVRVWVPRPWTAAEWAAKPPAVQAALTAAGNAETLRQRATSALAGSQAFLAIGTPTTAQVVAQVKALTLQSSALARLALGLLDSTN